VPRETLDSLTRFSASSRFSFSLAWTVSPELFSVRLFCRKRS
jgi:hypothetical protein